MCEGPLLDLPVWRLTDAEMESMCPEHQRHARAQLHDLKKIGALPVILTNPPGTKFETYWDGDGKQWQLRPIVEIDHAEILTAVRAVMKAEEVCANSDSHVDYATAISDATKLCRAIAEKLSPATEKPLPLAAK